VILDPAIHDVVDAAGWRAKFGIVSQADFDALSARVAALESALDQAEAELAALTIRVEALEAAPPGGGGGTNTSALVLGDDASLYRLKLRDVDGQPMLDQEPATFAVEDNPQILGDDGNVYRLRLRVVDGALVLDQEAV